MGLSSFNRMRRMKADVAVAEAERFQKFNQARHDARKHLNQTATADVEAQEAARQLEQEAVEKIGEAIVDGLDKGDLPMRQEHAAEIAGRNIEDPQGEPLSPVERVHERLQEGTANEELVAHTSADEPGPSAELVEAAQKEAGVIPDEEQQTKQTPADDPRTKVEIIEAWEHLDWPSKRALASQLSDEPVTNKVEAEAAIKAELARRAK